MTRRVLVATLVALLLPAAAGARGRTAHAAAHAAARPGPHFAIVPVGASRKGYYVLDVRRGQRLHETFAVTNDGDATGTVRLAGVDATTGQTSGAVYLDRRTPARRVGRWIRLGRTRLRLAPHQTVRVPFTVTVPAGARAGDHVGGIVAEGAAAPAPTVTRGKAGALAIRVRQLGIVAVQAIVPGPRVSRISVTSISAGRSNGYQWLYVGLRNDGNVLVKPAGTIVVRAASGAVVKRASYRLDTFVPQTAIAYPLVVRGKELSAGDYRATIEIARGARKPVRVVLPFSIRDGSKTTTYSSPKPQAPAAASPTVSARDGGPGHRFTLEVVGGSLALLLALLGALAWALRLGRRPAPEDGPAPATALRVAPEPPAADSLRPADSPGREPEPGPQRTEERPAAAAASVDAAELREAPLRRSFRGYAPELVHRLLARAAAALEETGRERDELHVRVEVVERALAEHQARELHLGRALLTAEQSAEALTAQARHEALLVLEEARVEARALVRDAEAERERLLAEARGVRTRLATALGVLDDRRLPGAVGHHPADAPRHDAGAEAA